MLPFDCLYRLMTKPLIIVPYIAFILFLIIFADKPLSSFLFHSDMRTHWPFLSYLTRIGLGFLYLLSFTSLIIYFRYLKKDPDWEAKFWFLFLCLSIPSMICIVLKIVFGRARPNLFLQGDDHVYGFYLLNRDAHFWSLPSGHTTTIMGVVLGLGILFPRYFYRLLALGFAVSFSRVLLTHHYLSDVLFTFYLTLLEIGGLLSVLKRKSWLTPAWKHTV